MASRGRAGRPRGARRSTRSSPRRGRRWWRCRCCSRPEWRAFDATIAVVADEALRARARRARGHEAVAERAGRQLSQDEKAQQSGLHGPQRRDARRVERDTVPGSCQTRRDAHELHAARIARRPRARRRGAGASALRGVGRARWPVPGGRDSPASDPLGDAVREITLPLRHEDIIRQQAADKDLDPSLIAAVIYEESRFRDQTSHAGAAGLMQITPETAASSPGIGRRPLRAGRPGHAADQHRLRRLVPALPASTTTTAGRTPLLPHTTPVSRTSTIGSARRRR